MYNINMRKEAVLYSFDHWQFYFTATLRKCMCKNITVLIHDKQREFFWYYYRHVHIKNGFPQPHIVQLLILVYFA